MAGQHVVVEEAAVATTRAITRTSWRAAAASGSSPGHGSSGLRISIAESISSP